MHKRINKWHRNYLIRRYVYGPCLRVFCHILYLFSSLIPKRLYALDRPVFVIGCSRSGTTAFIDYYKLHRDLCNWSEAAQIMELNYYDAGIDHVKDEDDINSFDAFRIRFFFGLKTRLTGKTKFINKHPENSLRIRYIKEIFPDALFIHIIRDGRATVESNFSRSKVDLFRSYYPFGDFVKPPKWKSYANLDPIEQYAHQWFDVVDYVRHTAREFLTDDEYIEVRYEDFCEKPNGLFNQLDEFCGLDPQRRFIDKIPSGFINHNDKWRTNLNEEKVKTINSIIAPLNQELGYY
jgi:hypothetical protein